jgi:hypothetical protein
MRIFNRACAGVSQKKGRAAWWSTTGVPAVSQHRPRCRVAYRRSSQADSSPLNSRTFHSAQGPQVADDSRRLHHGTVSTLFAPMICPLKTPPFSSRCPRLR